MGMQQQVVLQSQLPSWTTVRETLREHFGIVPEMRMIDGEIALPDEEPPDHWQELRIAAGDGSGGLPPIYVPVPVRVWFVNLAAGWAGGSPEGATAGPASESPPDRPATVSPCSAAETAPAATV